MTESSQNHQVSSHRATRARLLIAALVLAASTVACTGSDQAEPPSTSDTSYLQITDCRELERLASTEVDRINTSSDSEIVAAATVRFQSIVAHRDSVCG